MDNDFLLHRHSLPWLTRENHKVAIQHVLYAIKPQQLKDSLEADLGSPHHELKKDLAKFSNTPKISQILFNLWALMLHISPVLRITMASGTPKEKGQTYTITVARTLGRTEEVASGQLEEKKQRNRSPFSFGVPTKGVDSDNFWKIVATVQSHTKHSFLNNSQNQWKWMALITPCNPIERTSKNGIINRAIRLMQKQDV